MGTADVSAIRPSRPRATAEASVRGYRASLGSGIDGIRLRESTMPCPGPGEVVIRVGATSLSFRDLMILRGWYPLPVKEDVVLVSDGAGEVVELGEGVTRVAVG